MMNRAKAVVLAICLSAPIAQVQAQESEITLGKSTFTARCALCHGPDASGGGEIAELFKVPPADLTTLAARAGGSFPFSDVYELIAAGMDQPGHGDSEMPVWGDYFLADTLEDRGVSPGDALEIAAGRIFSVVLYLESIQK